jgi:hypothetical protein
LDRGEEAEEDHAERDQENSGGSTEHGLKT